jgi:mono/diheme cytochrome c family protein
LTKLAETAADPRTRLHGLWTLDGTDTIEKSTVIKALQDPSRDVRVSAIRIAERWLTPPDSEIQAAVLKCVDDPDWWVHEQLAASLGELPPGPRETALAKLLEKHAEDPVVMDAALSGLRGREIATLTKLLEPTVQTIQRETAIAMVTATIMRGADDTAVQAVFDRAAESTRPRWQRSAILQGAEISVLGATMPGPRRGPEPGSVGNSICPTCPPVGGGPGGSSAFGGGRGRAGAPAAGGDAAGAPAPAGAAADSVTAAAPGRGAAGGRGGAGGGRGRGNAGALLRLAREPASLSSLAGGSDELAPRAASLLARIEWPGKPGASAPVTPLTPVEQQRFNAGQQTFVAICAACHQEDGRGKERVAPSLVGSALATASADIPTRILLNGKEGPIGLMPPLGQTFTDEQIAAVLTYVRRQWGNSATPVDPALVKDTRAATASRTRPWTNDELMALAGAGRGGGH